MYLKGGLEKGDIPLALDQHVHHMLYTEICTGGDEARGALLGLAGQPVVEEMAGLEERGCCQGLKYCDAL